MFVSKYSLYNKCIVKGCPVGKKMFRIPLSCIIEWCANLNIDPTYIKKKHRICDRHFDNNCFGTWRLKKGAMPTLNLGHSNGPVYKEVTSSSEKKIRYRYCCVEGCNSDNRRYNLHLFPKDPELVQRWKDNIVIKKDFLNYKNLYICNKHMHTNDVCYKKLKKNSLPCMDTGCSNTHMSVEDSIEKMDQEDSSNTSGIVQVSNKAVEEMDIKEEIIVEEFHIEEQNIQINEENWIEDITIKEEPCIEEFQIEKEHSIKEMQIKEENWIEDIKIKEEPCIEEFQFIEEH